MTYRSGRKPKPVRLLAVLFMSLALASSPGAPSAAEEAAQTADLIFYNGVVFTAGDRDTLFSSVVIRGNTIVAVGDDSLARTHKARKSIDLHGRLLIPGFNDAHTHIKGRPARWIDLSGAGSIADIQDLVKRKVGELAPGAWITGYGWSEDQIREHRKPTRRDIDQVAPENPVLLTRQGGHSALANSRALEIAGITRDSPEPEAGAFERDHNGKLTGIIREHQYLVARHMPPADPVEVVASLERTLRRQFRFGITSLTNATTTMEDYRQYWRPLYQRSGGHLPRATVQIYPNLRAHTAEEAIARLRAFGLKTRDGNDFLRIGALKAFVDGGFTGPAAWTRKPYRNDPTYFGHPVTSMEEIEKLSRAAHDIGWQLGYHTIGDAAIEETARLFARILHDSPRPDARHYLNHFTVMPSAETMRLMAAAGIAIVQQPNFTYSLEGRYRAYLAGDRLAHNNPVRTPMAYGIPMAFSSDVIPIGPLVGIYASVTRRGKSGMVYGPDERVDVATALRAYTRTGAYTTFDENRKGTIEPGKFADLVVLDRNILTGDPDRILETRVDLTVLNGKIVYDRVHPNRQENR